VQAVAYLYEYDTYVIAHGEKQFLEVLGLCRGLITEYSAADFSQAVHYLGYFGTEDIFYVLRRIVRIFHHIMQQCGTNTCRPQSDFLASYLRYGYRVHYIWLSRQPSNSFMGLSRKVECLCDDIHFLAVTRRNVSVQQVLERAVD
jgi:hypothetical protein